MRVSSDAGKMLAVSGRSGARRGILIVGDRKSLHGRVRAGIARLRSEPIWLAAAPGEGYPIASARQPGLVVMDFRNGSDADVAADVFGAVVPRCWILDFNGVVRRRPEHASVSLAHTHPLVLSPR